MFTQTPIPWNKRKQKRKRNIFKTNAFSLSFVSFFLKMMLYLELHQESLLKFQEEHHLHCHFRMKSLSV